MGSNSGESRARLISGHRSRSDRPEAVIYGLRENVGDSAMIRGVRESSVVRKADNRIACRI
jgi:hypothetical protein